MDPQAATAEFLHRQSPQLEGTASAQYAIARVKYSHDAMIDLILAQPAIKQGEIAKHFGYSPAWVSRIMNSDAFLARLAQRKSDIIDPTLVMTVEEKLRAVAAKSLEVVLDKLESPAVTFDQALAASNMASKALGYGARERNLQVQTNFVVALPAKAESATGWAAKYSGPSPELRAMAAQVVDAEVKGG